MQETKTDEVNQILEQFKQWHENGEFEINDGT